MTKKILTLALLLFFYGTHAQYIQNVRFEPQYPGPTDSILLILDLQFTSGDCLISSASHSVSNDSIRIEVYHCPGPMAYICEVTDTINLGVLAAGHYTTDIIIHRKVYISPDPCLGGSPVDSTNRQLIVYSSTGINDQESAKSSVIYLSDSRELILGSSNQKDATILVFNFVGSLLLEKNIYASDRIQTQPLSQGIYFYKLINQDGGSHSGKFVVR